MKSSPSKEHDYMKVAATKTVNLL